MITKMKPADVFNGASVRRKFREEVKSLVKLHATSVHSTFRGNMISSTEDMTWDLFGGKAVLMGGRWGSPSVFSVPDEEVRAKLMLLMDVDLKKSKIYKKYATPSSV